MYRTLILIGLSATHGIDVFMSSSHVTHEPNTPDLFQRIELSLDDKDGEPRVNWCGFSPSGSNFCIHYSIKSHDGSTKSYIAVWDMTKKKWVETIKVDPVVSFYSYGPPAGFVSNQDQLDQLVYTTEMSITYMSLTEPRSSKRVPLKRDNATSPIYTSLSLNQNKNEASRCLYFCKDDEFQIDHCKGGSKPEFAKTLTCKTPNATSVTFSPATERLAWAIRGKDAKADARTIVLVDTKPTTRVHSISYYLPATYAEIVVMPVSLQVLSG